MTDVDLTVYTQIKNMKTGDVMAQVKTPDILSGDQFRWFWVSWNSGAKPGTGRIRVSTEIMTVFVSLMVEFPPL